MFAWCWVADLCADHQIEFVLGNSLHLKAIHGGKSKNDKLDRRVLVPRFSERRESTG